MWKEYEHLGHTGSLSAHPECQSLGRGTSPCGQIGHVTASYRVDIGDLRAPLTAQWTGVADGSGGLVAKAMFHSSGSFPIRATVRDVDGLSGTGGTTVSVSPLEGGQQPF
jgi:hypothetical protein